MKVRTMMAGAAILSAVLITVSAFASDTARPAKKQQASKRAKTSSAPSVQEQIEALRKQLLDQAGQIESLKNGMAAKDTELKQARQEAAEAQATAEKAVAAVNMPQTAASENAAAVVSLRTAVSGLKENQATLAGVVSEETAKIKKTINNPASLHFKGIDIVPYGFFEGDTVYRPHATGGELTTAFSAIPYEHADSYALSENYISARASRLGAIFEGKLSWGAVRGYAEGDFYGSGTTSNDNQTNSYVFRQRVLLGEAETNSHWTFSGGQAWTLLAETRKGISTNPANVATPQMVDPNYVAGYIWGRGAGFRVTKSFSNLAFAVALETPQLVYSASLAGNTPYAVLGGQGLNAGAFNAAVSSCSPSTSVVNYTNQVDGSSSSAVAVYKTVNACANLANISFNKAPDVLAKIAYDPGFGHYEVYGVARFGHETVYPGETTNSNLYGGLKDIATGAVVAPALSVDGAYENDIVLGGVGASARVPLGKGLTVGAKGLYGPGVGRYGNSGLPDVTSNASGEFSPVHDLSGLFTVEATPTPRVLIFSYYGGDYASRVDFGSDATTTLAAPKAEFCVTGTTTCTATPTAAQLAAGGTWGAHWSAPTVAAVGYGSRLLSNTACLATANPGYSGSSTGYYPGPSCSAQTRDVQEATLGYWYDLYKGDRGRLRQGIQYSYAVREAWSGAAGVGAKGIENMLFFSFRYQLP